MPLSALLATKPVSQPQMLIMDSSSVPRRQVLMSTSSQAPPFPNPSMLQMPLVPQYCLGPGAAYPPYGYVAARVPFHGQPSTAGSPPNGVAGHSTSSASSTSSSCSAAPNPSINRSQRCGVCRGCQCKPCGLCTYCQDSPQFGGPGVKKQSCIERRCLRVLENRLQTGVTGIIPS
uniref:CXXC-type domain-containing protein n=1 Tax=Ditylenchus dipsaci TaxID=166011 RepID=A0A915E7S2_9BILA